jgi:hypothetical protein
MGVQILQDVRLSVLKTASKWDKWKIIRDMLEDLHGARLRPPLG